MAGGALAPQPMAAPGPAPDPSNPFNYGAGKPASYGGKYKTAYDPYKLAREQYDSLYARGRYTSGREVSSNAAYDSALDNPMKQAQMFQGMYGDATQAMAAPILRQFQTALAANVGGSAARFGGARGSTEEAKGEFNTGDVFSRNLSEVVRANAGQAVNAGMDYTGMLGNRAAQAGQTVENNAQLKSQAGQNTKKPKGGLGAVLGGLAGGAIGAFAGGFGTSLGSKLGSKIGGG